MPPVNRNVTQRMRQVLYSLKREYGARIDITKLISTSTDVRTGVKVNTTSILTVWHAAVLPETVKRINNQSISLISSNKEFVQGGTYDRGSRTFIIDRRDVRSLPELNADDWIVYDARKFQIVTVEQLEVRAGWVITANELVGEIPEQNHFIAVSQQMSLALAAEGEVE